MKRLFYFLYLALFFVSCSNQLKSDSLCGTWYNAEEDTEVLLNCDWSFTAIGIPSDIDNCFFNTSPIKTIQGSWNIVEGNKIKLSFGRTSYCFIEIVNDEQINLRLHTKVDGNTIIDLTLKK